MIARILIALLVVAVAYAVLKRCELLSAPAALTPSSTRGILSLTQAPLQGLGAPGQHACTEPDVQAARQCSGVPGSQGPAPLSPCGERAPCPVPELQATEQLDPVPDLPAAAAATKCPHLAAACTLHCCAEAAGLQGPVAEIRVAEVSLGRSRQLVKTARNAWQAAVSLSPHLPLNIRGVVLVLRSPAAAAAAAAGISVPQARPKQRQKRPSSFGALATRLAVQAGTKLVFSVVPAIPIRMKQVVVQLQVTPHCD